MNSEEGNDFHRLIYSIVEDISLIRNVLLHWGLAAKNYGYVDVLI